MRTYRWTAGCFAALIGSCRSVSDPRCGDGKAHRQTVSRLTRSGVVAVGLAGCLAFTPAAAGAAPVKSAKAVGDPATVYTMSVGKLTVTSTDPVLLSAVRGQRVLATCDSRGGVFLGPKSVVWRKTASSFTFALHAFEGGQQATARDSASIIACSVASESQGGVEELGGVWPPFSRAAFTHAGLLQFAQVPGSPVLAVASSKLSAAGAAFLHQARSGTSFPSARAAVLKIDAVLARHKLAQNVLYAATSADVTNPNAVYVVSSGSSSTSVELAGLVELNVGGSVKPYAMQCRANGTLGPAHQL